MTKATRLALVIAVVLALASSAFAGGGTGAYEWRISFSNSDPTVQTAPDFTPGAPQNLYLWYMGCNSGAGSPGMSACDIGVVVTNWTFLAFNVQSPFLNAGSGQNLLLAVGGCPTGPLLAGAISVFVLGPGAARLGLSVNNIAVTVDCDSPIPAPWSWPDQMLFMGAKTNGFGGTAQAWGHGCTTDPVEASTWGGMKSLYR